VIKLISFLLMLIGFVTVAALAYAFVYAVFDARWRAKAKRRAIADRLAEREKYDALDRQCRAQAADAREKVAFMQELIADDGDRMAQALRGLKPYSNYHGN